MQGFICLHLVLQVLPDRATQAAGLAGAVLILAGTTDVAACVPSFVLVLTSGTWRAARRIRNACVGARRTVAAAGLPRA